jgi:isopenicillin N synthase-like dioxygenase
VRSEIPIIDVSPLATGDARGAAKVAAEIGAACRDIGFFYVAGHPVPPSLMSEAFAASAAFFDQPDTVKRSVLYAAAGNRGYVPMKGEALNPSRPADLKEAFNIGLELLPDDPELVAGRMFRAQNLWPGVAGFRDTMLSYFDACHGLGRLLHRAFAIDLGLAPDFFEDKLDRPMAVLRLLHYPPAPSRAEAGQLGAGDTPTMAASRCLRPMASAGWRCARAPASG